MAKRFKKGKVIKSMDDLLKAIDAGQWLYWRRRPVHPQIINNMSLKTVYAALRGDCIHEAIDKWK